MESPPSPIPRPPSATDSESAPAVGSRRGSVAGYVWAALAAVSAGAPVTVVLSAVTYVPGHEPESLTLVPFELSVGGTVAIAVFVAVLAWKRPWASEAGAASP